MTWDGVTTVEITAGREGLYGIRNRNMIPIGGLVQLRNATLEDHSWRTGGGASVLGSTLGASVAIAEAMDYWPGPQRTLAVGDDGAIYKDDGSGGGWVTLVSGLTTVAGGAVPFLYEAGREAAGNDRLAIYCDRVNAPRVLVGDAATMSAFATPAADWTGSNQPGFGVIHQNRNCMAGNANFPATLYVSPENNHQDMGAGSVTTFRIFPGEYERLVAGLSYKGVLILWGYPRGVYALDTSDPTISAWRVIKVGTPGAAGPRNVAALEDDVTWVAPDGSWHLLSATTATGSVRAEDLAIRKLGSYIRDQVNLTRLAYAHLIYYSHKQEVQLACSASGTTAKNRRLHLDLNRRTEVGERWVWWDADRNEALFLRKLNEVHIPAMGDEQGRIWQLDRTSRNRNGAGYTFEWMTRDSDFGEVVPGWQGRWKNLRFLQIEYDGRTTGTHTVEVYTDGDLQQTIAFSLTASGLLLPFTLPATLGTDALRLTQRRRLVGRGRRVAFRGTSSAADLDVSVTRLLIGLEVGE